MIEKEQQNEVTLPHGVQEDLSRLVVVENIDGKEESLSGKISSFTKGECKLLSVTLLNSSLFYYVKKSNLSYNFSD